MKIARVDEMRFMDRFAIEKLGIPEDHHIGYMMVFGKPAIKYHRTVQRGDAQVNRVTW